MHSIHANQFTIEAQSTVLLMHASAERRQNLEKLFSVAGFKVNTAVDGVEGVRSCLIAPPRLIVAELDLPSVDGYSLLKVLGENELTAGIPILLIDGPRDVTSIRRAMLLGADDYLPDPCPTDELLEAVAVRLRKARYRGPLRTPGHTVLNPRAGQARLARSFRQDGTAKRFAPGSDIIREGQRATYLYRVEQGFVHLTQRHPYGRDYIIAELGRGEIFGLSTVLEQSSYHYTVRVAGKEASVTMLPARALLDLVATDHAVADSLMHFLAGLTNEFSNRIVGQAYDSVQRRTALLLCELHERYRPDGITLTREELAQMVGTTKESISRTLSSLRKNELIEVRGRDIFVLQPKELAEIKS